MSYEQRSLQRERQGFREASCLALPGTRQQRFGRVQMRVVAAVRAARRAQFSEQGFHRGGLLRQRSQDVEADDVSRAFPDRVERRLPVEARNSALLDVAISSQAL